MDPILGTIIMFAGNFAPRGWALCDGQLLAINSNTALFSILGTIYGGDGRTTFGLPDLRGRLPMHAGQGPGLVPRPLGQKSGAEINILNENQLPAHNHAVSLPAKEEANAEVPANNFIAGAGFDGFGTISDTIMGALPQNNVGGNQPVNNMQPYQ
ncbi:phage tail protein [Maribacter ulvicola]|uniref:Microcystin-dependent protein n=1 Tax=Maribacter ulvicola TaxID=228959 RepID=A0A1N6XDR0_9FLAO|nr:tail fiber protein [Maribacter ulvicola]SIR00443.1 Microcystin-dependent protein [Maribacter ulvicola]